jgi:adenylate cyclase
VLQALQNRRTLTGLTSGLAGALVAGLLVLSGMLLPWEASTWDMRVVRAFKAGEHTDNIRVVLLDQQSLDWARDQHQLTWPWMRESYGLMLNFFNRAEPKAIIFDWLYLDPSSYGPEDDKAFVAAISNSPSFVGAVLSTDHGTAQWPAKTGAPALAPEGLADWQKTKAGRAASKTHVGFPIDGIREAASWLGDVTHQKAAGQDATVRRVSPLSIFDNQLIPSLGIAGLLAGAPQTSLRFDGNNLQFADHVIPLDSNAQTILRYRGPSQTHKTVNAAAIIESEMQLLSGVKPTLSPEAFRGKYIFFGPSAPGLEDLKPTPSGGVGPGVEMHATLLDNVLSDDLIRDTAPGINLLWSLALALLTGVLSINARRAWQSLLLFGGGVTIPYAIGVLAYEMGFWLPVVAPTIAVLTALLVGLASGYALEGRQRQFIKSAFDQYLSPQVIDKLIANPHSLQLGGELRELTLFFSDLKGFSTISEQLGPTKLTRLLNDYLSEMCDIILDEGGTIDKYEGDAIIAFWNAPLDVPDHAERAVRAALRCNRRLAELRPKFKEEVGHELYARIGLNTGQVVVGNMGSRQRFDYTFLGDAGNLAARLEGANKAFASWIMISGETMRRAGDGFSYRKLARITVVGRKQAIDVYEPSFSEDYEPRVEAMERFHQALSLFDEGRFAEALPTFEAIAAADPTAAIYRDRCATFVTTPPTDWDGTWHLDTK